MTRRDSGSPIPLASSALPRIAATRIVTPVRSTSQPTTAATARLPRRVAVTFVVALLGVIAGSAMYAGPASAQNGTQLNRCVIVPPGTGYGAQFSVITPIGPGITAVRGELVSDRFAGNLTVHRGSTHDRGRTTQQADKPGGSWELHREGQRVGGCGLAGRLNPTAVDPSLVWLPGGRVVGEGVRGPARVTWSPVSHRGTAASHYEIVETEYERFNDGKIVSSTVVAGDVTTFDVDLDDEEQVYVRAWWANGVSTAVEAISPRDETMLFFTRPRPSTDLRFGPLQVAWAGGTRENSGAVLRWDPAVDATGRRADRYEVVAFNNHDGTRQLTMYVKEVFGPNETEGAVELSSNFLGGPAILRAVWVSGGPAGGPRFVDVALPDFSGVRSTKLTRIRPTEASFRILTNRCEKPVYSLLATSAFGHEAATTGVTNWLEQLNATRSTQPCSRLHTVDLDATNAGLTPGSSYILTVNLPGERRGTAVGQIGFSTPPLSMMGEIAEWDRDSNPRVMRVRGWLIDGSQKPSKRVRLHAFVDGKRVKGAVANVRHEAMLVGSRYGPFPSPLDSYGARHGFVINVPIPARGNHVVCLRAINSDARAGEARYPLIGCRASNESGGPLGAFESLRWDSSGRLFAAGLAANTPQCCLVNPAKVAFFVDGKKVSRAPSRRVDVDSIAWNPLGGPRFRARIPVSDGAKQVCAVVVGESSFQHIGCRNIPPRP